jgi:hypothetical protein
VVADRVLMLDQGMIMGAIANALADDAMRKAFVDESFEKIIRPLVALEEFTARPAHVQISHTEQDDETTTSPGSSNVVGYSAHGRVRGGTLDHRTSTTERRIDPVEHPLRRASFSNAPFNG